MKNKPVKNKPASITYEISCLHSGVTGSSIILMIHFPNGDTRHILIDCGMYQEFEYNKYNFDFPTQFHPENIDYVFFDTYSYRSLWKIAALGQKRIL